MPTSRWAAGLDPTLRPSWERGSEWALPYPTRFRCSAQKMIEKESDESFQIPLHVPVKCIDVYSEPEEVSPFVRWVRKNLGFAKFGMKHSREWVATYANAEVTTNNCNVVSLGGITRGNTNGLVTDRNQRKRKKRSAFRIPIRQS